MYRCEIELTPGKLVILQDPGHDVVRDGSTYSLYSNILWDAAVVLAKWMDSSSLIRTGDRVIELGAGLGTAGLAASVLGANVSLTDLSPLDLLRKNARLNEADVQVVELDWEWAQICPGKLRHAACQLGSVDWVIGCDILFHATTYSPILQTIAILASQTTQVLLTFTARYGECVQDFVSVATALDFDVQVVPACEHNPSFSDPKISILRLQLSNRHRSASYLIVCDEQVIKVLVSLAMIERASEIQSIEVVSATALQVIFQHGYKDLRIILPECVCEETVHAYFDVAKRELIIKCDFEAMSSTNRV